MITVLETVANAGPVSAAALARMCDINRTVAHRLLVTLAQRAYVQKGEEGYVLGPAVRRLAQVPESDLVSVSKPIMQSLADKTGETVVLHSLEGTDAMVLMVLDQVVSKKHIVRVEHHPGSRHPLYKGASGWSILANQSSQTIKRLLEKVEDRDAAIARIEQVRADGYALSHNELQMGVSSIAAPLIENNAKCRASLAILVPDSREDVLQDLIPELLRAAAVINVRLR